MSTSYEGRASCSITTAMPGGKLAAPTSTTSGMVTRWVRRRSNSSEVVVNIGDVHSRISASMLCPLKNETIMQLPSGVVVEWRWRDGL